MQITKFPIASTAARFLLALTTGVVLSTAPIFANAAAATVTEKAIHTFPPGNKQGAGPVAPLIFDAAGNLYGTTDVGGTGCSDGCGTVYELKPKSSGSWTETVLYAFKGGNDGAHPYAGLILDSAGNLYGTTQQGGGTGCARTGCGTVFELTPSGNGTWVEEVLYRFQGGTDGESPTASLVFDSAGNLYGTTFTGGVNNTGTIFELSHSGSGWIETILYSFAGDPDGSDPYSGLVFGTAGNLYGTTVGGGAYGFGTVFRLNQVSGGWAESILYSFTGETEGYPYGDVIFDGSGNLYGTTGLGTIFELTPASSGWTESLLYAFPNSQRSTNFILGGLTLDGGGNLFGTTYLGGDSACSGGCGLVFELTQGSNSHWIEITAHNFAGSDGEYPYAGLILDRAGNLYGTTASGGLGGIGTVFEVKPRSGGWSESVLWAFRDVDGKYPQSNLIFDQSGDLFGTTNQGGAHNLGAVFELTPSASVWKENVVYSFKGGNDGANPHSGLILDSAGNLYGTTESGGGSGCVVGCGTVFELTPSSNGTWVERVLYSFTGGNDGEVPFGSLVFDSAGNLYGTTSGGGTGCSSGCGTVFELTPSGNGRWVEKVLYSFQGGKEGQSPVGSLIFDSAGNLYGTTSTDAGTVFKLTPTGNGAWVENVLYAFPGGKGGYEPQAGLIFDANGNLYGTTSRGGVTGCGSVGCGTVFELSPIAGGQWTEAVLYRFTGKSDGAYPTASLIFDSVGNLYSTTEQGGGTGCPFVGCGTVFELSPIAGGQWTEAVLYRFTGKRDGAMPEGGLVTDPQGNLYGNTMSATPTTAGVVFELTP